MEKIAPSRITIPVDKICESEYSVSKLQKFIMKVVGAGAHLHH